MKIWKRICQQVLGLFAAMAAFTAAAAPTVIYYHNDLAGSPVVASDANGNEVGRETYRPYGERLTNAPAGADNKVWFTSRRQDVETGLVYMGARYYDPVIGRFISKDPVGFDEANIHSHNRYAYANNNPYRYVDPDGHQAVPPLPQRLGTAVPALGPLGKPTEAGQLKALEGFGSSAALPALSSPGISLGDLVNFAIGGFGGIEAGRLSNLIFNAKVERPPGVPENWVEVSGKKEGHFKWVNPANEHDYVRAKPDGTLTQVRDGKAFDVAGNRVDLRSPEAHGITPDKFVFQP